MPGYWAPWPGKTNTVLAAEVGQVMVSGQLRVGSAGAQGIEGVEQVFARIGGCPPAR